MPRLARSATGGAGLTPYPSLASDSTSAFTPQVWSSKLIQKFYPATVFGEIANIDYQGEISQMGDSVVIRTTPGIAITNYEVGMDLTYETPESPKRELEINKGKSFAFMMENVDRFQSDIDLMNDWAQSASEELKVSIDRDILADVFVDADVANAGVAAGAISGDIDMGAAGAPVQLTPVNIVDFCVDMGTVLDEQDVPETDRWLLLPAAFCAMIKKSELKDASIAGDDQSIVRNGRLGMLDRFTIYSSNLLSSAVEGAGRAFNIMAGHKSGMTFAAQMEKDKLVHMLNPNKHGELIRGLCIYGYEVIKPTSIVHGYVQKA